MQRSRRIAATAAGSVAIAVVAGLTLHAMPGSPVSAAPRKSAARPAHTAPSAAALKAARHRLARDNARLGELRKQLTTLNKELAK